MFREIVIAIAGFGIGWLSHLLWRALFGHPVEGVYWDDKGMPHIVPGYFPPPPKCKKPKILTGRKFDAKMGG